MDTHCSCLRNANPVTSLNKESGPFFPGDNYIWSFLSPFLPLAITAFGAPEGYFSLAIVAFGAFEFLSPKHQYRSAKMEMKESRLLIFKDVRVCKEQ